MYPLKLNTITLLALAIVYLVHVFGTLALVQENFAHNNDITGKSFAQTGSGGLFSMLERTSRQSLGFISNLFVSIPFGRMILVGGALLSLFFLFARLIIVLAPILILGAMARESTDATDLIKMLIDFYNQVVVALDEQNIPNK